jgi:hypothetical protein
MKNKYLVTGLCLLVLMLCLVSACGGGATSTTTPGTTTAASTSPSTTPTNPSPTTSPTQTMTTSSTTGSSIGDILGLGANIGSVKYDMTITAAEQTVTAKIWQKQKKMREEMTMQGITTVIIFDLDTGIMYTFMPAENMAIKMTLNPSQIPQGSTEGNADILKYNPYIVGTESIDGKSCTVIVWDVPETGSMKEWVWTEKGFPLKMEVTANGMTTTIENTNIDFSDIPDSTFELPKDVQIINQ